MWPYFAQPPVPTMPTCDPEPVTTTPANLLYSVLNGIKQRENVPLGSAFASPMLFPLPKQETDVNPNLLPNNPGF